MTDFETFSSFRAHVYRQHLRRWISRYTLISEMRSKMSYPLSAILQFLGPFRTRSARSTGTCLGPLSQPTSRKYARWRRSLRGRPSSMVDRPSANRELPAEIHLRCTSAKEFRRKELMRIKKGDPRAQKREGVRAPPRLFLREKSDLYIPENVYSNRAFVPRLALISGAYRFISRVIDSALPYL